MRIKVVRKSFVGTVVTVFRKMAQFSSQLKLLPSREVQESLLNCVEEGTTMVTSLVDGSLSNVNNEG
jgi:hypothetical protein